MLAVAAFTVTLSTSVQASASGVTATGACTGGIFLDTARSGPANPPASPTVRRQRRVEVDFARMFPGGDPPAAAGSAERVTLNLFPDVCVTAVRDRATDLGPGKVQWEGHVPGGTPGTATMIVDGTLMVGTVRNDRDVYEIRSLGDGIHGVTDVDTSKFPRD
jgi:hypothetical protein